jgi:hypothetical protein
MTIAVRRWWYEVEVPECQRWNSLPAEKKWSAEALKRNPRLRDEVQDEGYYHHVDDLAPSGRAPKRAHSGKALPAPLEGPFLRAGVGRKATR